jgi:hypothetical protein
MRQHMWLLALTLMSSPVSCAAGGISWGVELGSHYSTFDEVSPANGAHIDSRLLPAAGVFLDHPLYRNFSLLPTLRYTQQGEKTSWINSSAALAGEEAVLEHTVSTGIEIRYKAARAAFLSLSPELSYLVAGKWTRDVRSLSTPTQAHDEDSYAGRSDRWNAVVRAGTGASWDMAGGEASVTLRYVRGVNTMTRVLEIPVAPSQRNIAWTAVPVPPFTSEWRTQGVELLAGFAW